MANTYTQLYIQFVFAVKYRERIISEKWEDRLHRHIISIIQNNGHKVLAINSAKDHIHIFIGLNPKQSISELMKQVKGDSSEWINKEKLTLGKFSWQQGYGAFSYSREHIDHVVNYILNQKEHHKVESFRDEYIKLLEEFNIDFDEKYIFKDVE